MTKTFVIPNAFRSNRGFCIHKNTPKSRVKLHNIFDAIFPLSAQNWRGLPPLAQMHKKRPFLRAGVEGRQSRAEGSGGGRAPAADASLMGHGDVHSGDGCRDRMREACALPRGAQGVMARSGNCTGCKVRPCGCG